MGVVRPIMGCFAVCTELYRVCSYPVTVRLSSPCPMVRRSLGGCVYLTETLVFMVQTSR